MSPRKEKSARTLRWIAAYTIVKGALLIALAIGLLGLLHKDVDAVVGKWISLLGLDLANRHVAALLARLDLITDKQVSQLAALAFLLGGVFSAQGFGLICNQRWAKYLTIVVTASFIPVELFEAIHRFGFGKLAILAVNSAIVSVLVAMLRKELRSEFADNSNAGMESALNVIASEDLT